MNLTRLQRVFAAAAGLALAGGLSAQDSAPANRAILFPPLPDASPKCTLKQRVGLTDIEIVYSRPSMKRHLVFGGIVPYGFVWRTGDNASTKITFSTPVKLNGVVIPPGKYALYSIPDEKEWSIILYKDAGLWGVDGYDPGQIVAQISATPVKLTEWVQTFTIGFDDLHDDSAILNLTWARTQVPVKLELNILDDLMIKVAASMSSPGKKLAATYVQAAEFYLNHTQESRSLAQALMWVDMGLADNPPIAYQLLYLKAQLLSRQGNRAGALEAAQQSTQLAVQAEGPSTPYVKLNSEVISSPRQ